MLDPCYDIVRKQIAHPEERIYPEGFWLTPSYPKSMSGIYFVMDKGIECLLSLFTVKTDHTERMFGTILPIPVRDVNEAISKLNALVEAKGQLTVSLYPREQHNEDYLRIIPNIKAMKEWISSRGKD